MTGLACSLGNDPSTVHEALCDGRSALVRRQGAWLAGRGRTPLQLALQATSGLEIPRTAHVLVGTSGSDPARDATPAPRETLAEAVRRRLALEGMAVTVNAACASGLVALGMARDLGEPALVVAVDALSQTTARGFGGMGALATHGVHPLSQERSGLGLGEAAAAVLAHELPVSAWAESCDATSLAAPDGRGLRACLERTGGADVVFAHATGTVKGDAAELEAVDVDAPITGTKGALGHSLGAGGLVDVVLALESLRTGQVPGVVGLRTPLDDRVLASTAQLNPRSVAVLAAGFGGFNAAVVLG